MRAGVWFLSLVILVSCAAGPPALRTPAARPPARLPEVELLTLTGQPIRLAAALRGRVGVVSLWATWCAGCRAELDALDRLHERVRGRGAAVVAIAVGETRDTVIRFLDSHAVHYTQLIDERF